MLVKQVAVILAVVAVVAVILAVVAIEVVVHTVLEKAIQVTISLFGCYPLYLHGINSLWSYYWSYNGKKIPSMSGMSGMSGISGMLKMSGETDRH